MCGTSLTISSSNTHTKFQGYRYLLDHERCGVVIYQRILLQGIPSTHTDVVFSRHTEGVEDCTVTPIANKA